MSNRVGSRFAYVARQRGTRRLLVVSAALIGALFLQLLTVSPVTAQEKASPASAGMGAKLMAGMAGLEEIKNTTTYQNVAMPYAHPDPLQLMMQADNSQSNQKWTRWESGIPGWILIRNAHTEMCMGAHPDGWHGEWVIANYSCSTSSVGSLWQLRQISAGKWMLVHNPTGMCLDITTVGDRYGRLQLWSCTGKWNQSFSFRLN